MRTHLSILGLSTTVGFLLCTSAIAQEADTPPPPTFPVKLRAPEMATWTISVEREANAVKPETQEGGDTATSAPLKQLTVTKTGPIYSEKAVTANGGTWEKWVFVIGSDNYRFIRNGGSQKWERLWDAFYEDVSRYNQSDFEDFEWIDKDAYKGVETLDEVVAFSFEKSGTGPITRRDAKHYDPGAAAEGTATQSFSARGWLDAKTLLPVKFDDGREVRTYTFGEPPTSRQTPPAEVLEDLKKWIATAKQMNR